MKKIPMRVYGAWAYKCTHRAEEHETLPCAECQYLDQLSGKYLDKPSRDYAKSELLKYNPETTLIAYGIGTAIEVEDV